MRAIQWLAPAFALALLPSPHASKRPTLATRHIASSVWIMSVNYRYSNLPTVRSIRDVDFNKLRVIFFNGIPNEHYGYQLEDGAFAAGGESVSLDDVQYFSIPTGKADRALASLTDLACGGSCSENGDVMVFELRGGKLFETQQIVYDHQAPGAGVIFSPTTGVLVVTGRLEDSSAHCCPDAVVVVTLKWDGTSFQVRNVKKQPISEAR